MCKNLYLRPSAIFSDAWKSRKPSKEGNWEKFLCQIGKYPHFCPSEIFSQYHIFRETSRHSQKTSLWIWTIRKPSKRNKWWNFFVQMGKIYISPSEIFSLLHSKRKMSILPLLGTHSWIWTTRKSSKKASGEISPKYLAYIRETSRHSQESSMGIWTTRRPSKGGDWRNFFVQIGKT